MLEENTANRRNVLQVVVAGSDAGIRAQPVEVLTKLTEPEIEVRQLDLDAGIEGEPAQVMMVVFGDDEEAPLALLQETSGRTVRPTAFAVLPKRSPSLLRRALRAGADEILFLPLEADDAARALFKISEARRRNLRGGYGKVLSLLSMVGGVGTTTLAAHLALALRRLGKQVAVVDLDLQLGSLGVLLNIEPSRTIVDLADPQKKLDSIQLDLTLTRQARESRCSRRPNWSRIASAFRKPLRVRCSTSWVNCSTSWWWIAGPTSTRTWWRRAIVPTSFFTCLTSRWNRCAARGNSSSCSDGWGSARSSRNSF